MFKEWFTHATLTQLHSLLPFIFMSISSVSTSSNNSQVKSSHFMYISSLYVVIAEKLSITINYGVFYFLAWRILVPQPGIEPQSSEVEMWSLNHWTAREFPPFHLLHPFICQHILKFRVPTSGGILIWPCRRSTMSVPQDILDAFFSLCVPSLPSLCHPCAQFYPCLFCPFLSASFSVQLGRKS